MYKLKKKKKKSKMNEDEGEEEERGKKVMEDKGEADGDEELGRVAKPLRKKDKTLWIYCT